VIAHYDQQSPEEGAVEIEAAPEAPGEAWMSVPAELAGPIAELIENHQAKLAHSRSRNGAKKSRTRKS
jgi:hypothetical protein